MPVKRRARPPRDERALTAIGQRLRQLRGENRLTADEVARQQDHTPQWLYEIERGASTLNFIDAVGLARIYGCPLEMFAGPTATFSVFRQPQSLGDWQAMYRDNAARASAHFNLDRLFGDAEKSVSS
jgi:transcriptional regulator with XRE-family HTH domain